MDVARSAPQGAHYHADVIYLLPKMGNKEGSKNLMVLQVRPKPTRVPPSLLYTTLDNTPLHSIPALLLYPPHAIVLKLHGRESNIAILVPETAGLLGL